MKDLRANRKFLPASPALESKELSSLVGMLNTHAGITPPKELSPVPVAIKAAAPVEPTRITSTPQTPVSSQASGTGISKVFLTGRMKVGKDFIAERAGFKIHALADPLYFVLNLFFGDAVDKNSLGARAFLQKIGQIGRGTVNAEYPLTVERALIIAKIREDFLHATTSKVDWASYGRNENIWLDALVARVNAEPAGTRVVVSGVRFLNEHERLTKEGFTGFHVMTSAATWAARLKQVGLTPESPAVKDLSEQLAASLDQSVTKQLSTQRTGPKLACVWSDERVPAPSGRLLTVADFCAMFSK